MKAVILEFLRDDEGATAIEYGIIAGLMAVILVAVFGTGTTTGLGKTLFDIFELVATKAGV